MRSSPLVVPLLCLLATPVLAGCPYARQLSIDTDRVESPHVPHAVRSEPTSYNHTKGVFLLNRIGPGSSELYIANADGSKERPLLSDPIFEYHAEFSPDGQWITFTGERNGDGNSDIYRVRPDGSDLEELVATPAVEDSVVISPNGKLAAFVSTANSFTANIVLLDLATGVQRNLTKAAAEGADPAMMNGYFRPSFSPDGQWVAFSSDRNMNWAGHGDPVFQGLSGWEHTQELSIYAIRIDGTGFRKVITKPGYSLGSPKWSKDGKRIVYYEMSREATWGAHRPESVYSTNSTIVSVDFATGKNRKVEVSGAGVKTFPQYINNGTLGYHSKGATEGIYTTDGGYVNRTVRSPSWSPDGKYIVYEKTEWNIRPMEKKLYSWDPEWEYRFTDVFPQLSSKKRIAMTEKQLGNSSLVSLNTDGSDETLVFNNADSGLMPESLSSTGLAGAFQPAWSPDGEWVVFGEGAWFQTRAKMGGWLIRATANGSYSEMLTNSTVSLTNTSAINSGFPSYSHDGKKIVFRVWGANSTNGDRSQLGLRLLDLETRKTTVLTNDWDNLPFFSPDGERIVFTRKTDTYNYDVCTMRPDGTDIRVLTSSGGNDAHAVWSHDGRIMYSTGMYGFQYECGLYDDTFQPYGQIVIMDADGSNKRPLTNSIWEDSMPLYLPNSVL